jgi:transposase
MTNITTTSSIALVPGLEAAWRDVDSSFDRFCLVAGIGAMEQVLREDAQRLTGPRHGRVGQRWGMTKGKIGFHGGNVAVRRPRVRSYDGYEAGKFRELMFCYEAGPTGYGLHRQITALGHACSVIAPSLIPKRPGEHVKTNRRDALSLARLHRAGELTTIWVPDPGHEAIRDLVRAREAAMEDLREKRQHLQSFLLRHGRIYPGLRSWTLVHARWLSNLTFEHPAQYLVLREYRQAIEDAEARLERLTQQVANVVSTWSMAPVVDAYQSMRGVAFLTAVTFVAEIGDVRRFETPRRLMAYLGLVPSERSTGEQVRRGSITKAGNPRARRVLIEGAWTYRYPARLSRPLQVRDRHAGSCSRGLRL